MAPRARRATAEERYGTLFSRAPVGILFADGQSVYLDANEHICRLLGYTRDELIGLSAADILVPDEVPHVGEAIAGIQRDNEFRRVFTFRRKDGSTFIGDVIATSFPDGTLLGMVRDITDEVEHARARREAEEAAQNEQRFAAAMLESMPGLVYLYDFAGQFLRWNRNFERVSGYSADEIATMRPLDFFHESERTHVAARIAEVFESGESALEADFLAKDGTRTPHLFTGRLLRFDGRDCLAGVGVDISQRRQLEGQLRQAQKMEAIGRLAGGIAHDFNNLLTVILGYSDELKAAAREGSEEAQAATAIHDAASRATTLTRQLLTFSRQQVVQPRVVDVNELVTESSRLLARLIGEDIEYLTRLAPEGGTVRVDPGQFDQVLMNLAVNARDAMPEGGRLVLETARVQLSAEYAASHLDCRPGDYMLIAMSDTGTGMTPDVMARIFEPFFTTKDHGRGTGLGLATVFGIVQQCDGGIHVYSEPDVGTTFKLYLPIVDAELRRVSGPQQVMAERGTETILLVEDDDAVRRLAADLLSAQGYALLLATDGVEALRRAQSHTGRIHLLLTDVVLPHLSGPNLVSALRVLRPGLPVLFMSGYTDDAVVRAGLLDASVSFIQKPFTARALADRVRSLLDAVEAD